MYSLPRNETIRERPYREKNFFSFRIPVSTWPFPTICRRGTGPMKRLSAELFRLSPIIK